MRGAAILAGLLSVWVPASAAELSPTLKALATAYGADVPEPVAVYVDLPHLSRSVDGVSVVGAGRWSSELGVCVRWTRTSLFNPEPAISIPVVEGSVDKDVERAHPVVSATMLQPSYSFGRGKDACADANTRPWFELAGVAPSRRVFEEASRRLRRLRSRRALGLTVSCATAFDCESWRRIEVDRYAAPDFVSRSQAGWRFDFSRSDIPPPFVQYRARLTRSHVEIVRAAELSMLARLKLETPDVTAGRSGSTQVR